MRRRVRRVERDRAAEVALRLASTASSARAARRATPTPRRACCRARWRGRHCAAPTRAPPAAARWRRAAAALRRRRARCTPRASFGSFAIACSKYAIAWRSGAAPRLAELEATAQVEIVGRRLRPRHRRPDASHGRSADASDSLPIAPPTAPVITRASSCCTVSRSVASRSYMSRPAHHAVAHVHEPRRDAQPLALALHRALELLRHVQRLPDVARRLSRSRACAAARVGDTTCTPGMRASAAASSFVMPVGEVRVARVAADAHERQHDDARCRPVRSPAAPRTADRRGPPKRQRVALPPRRRARSPPRPPCASRAACSMRHAGEPALPYAPTHHRRIVERVEQLRRASAAGRSARAPGSASRAPTARPARRRAPTPSGGGSSVMRAASSARGASPAKGGSPASISYAVTPKRVDVGAVIDVRIGRRLLRRHVQRRAERRAGIGERAAALRRPSAAPS